MTFCLLGENCSVFDRQNECPGISLHNPLCDGCRNRAEAELNLLRYDYVDLSQMVPKTGGHSEVKISRPKPESSPPLDMSVITLRSQLAWVAVQAELHLRVRLGNVLSVSLPVREGFGLDSSVRYLRARVDDLALLPAAAGPVGEDGVALSGLDLIVMVGRLHRRVRQVIGVDPRTITVPGDCPQCSTPTLRRHDDDTERVWCCRCRLSMSKAEYHRAARMQFAPSCQAP
jgi:ribosomal protein L37AE/L43A